MAGGHAGRDHDLVQRGQGLVYRGVVPDDDVAAAAAVGLGDRRLDRRDRLIPRQHAGDGEEAGLQDGIDPAGQAGRAGDLGGVDHVQREPLGQDLLLDRAGQAGPDAVAGVRAVQQDGRAGRSPAQHIHPLQQLSLVDAHEQCVMDEIGSADRGRPEAEVGDGLRAGLLRVVDEVSLGVQARVAAEDLDGVLVRADGAVRAEAEEHGPDRARRLDVQIRVVVQADPAHVVGDADGEPRLGPRGSQVGEDAGHHARGELLRGEPVPAAGDHRHGVQAPARVRFGQGAEHVQEQRLAQ